MPGSLRISPFLSDIYEPVANAGKQGPIWPNKGPNTSIRGKAGEAIGRRFARVGEGRGSPAAAASGTPTARFSGSGRSHSRARAEPGGRPGRCRLRSPPPWVLRSGARDGEIGVGALTPSAGRCSPPPRARSRPAGIGWRKAEIAFEVVEGAARSSAIAAADPLSGTRRPLGKVAARVRSSPRLCGLAPVRFRGVALRRRSWLAAQNRSFKSVFTVIRVGRTVPCWWKRKFPVGS
jgi:hypothetical protein